MQESTTGAIAFPGQLIQMRLPDGPAARGAGSKVKEESEVGGKTRGGPDRRGKQDDVGGVDDALPVASKKRRKIKSKSTIGESGKQVKRIRPKSDNSPKNLTQHRIQEAIDLVRTGRSSSNPQMSPAMSAARWKSKDDASVPVGCAPKSSPPQARTTIQSSETEQAKRQRQAVHVFGGEHRGKRQTIQSSETEEAKQVSQAHHHDSSGMKKKAVSPASPTSSLESRSPRPSTPSTPSPSPPPSTCHPVPKPSTCHPRPPPHQVLVIPSARRPPPAPPIPRHHPRPPPPPRRPQVQTPTATHPLVTGMVSGHLNLGEMQRLHTRVTAQWKRMPPQLTMPGIRTAAKYHARLKELEDQIKNKSSNPAAASHGDSQQEQAVRGSSSKHWMTDGKRGRPEEPSPSTARKRISPSTRRRRLLQVVAFEKAAAEAKAEHMVCNSAKTRNIVPPEDDVWDTWRDDDDVGRAQPAAEADSGNNHNLRGQEEAHSGSQWRQPEALPPPALVDDWKDIQLGANIGVLLEQYICEGPIWKVPTKLHHWFSLRGVEAEKKVIDLLGSQGGNDYQLSSVATADRDLGQSEKNADAIVRVMKHHHGEVRSWPTRSLDTWRHILFELYYNSQIAEAVGQSYQATDIHTTITARLSAADSGCAVDYFSADHLKIDGCEPDLNQGISTLAVYDQHPGRICVRQNFGVTLPEVFHHFGATQNYATLLHEWSRGRVLMRARPTRGGRGGPSSKANSSKRKLRPSNKKW